MRLICISLLLLCLSARAQTVINYSNLSASTGCVFNSPTQVPATINGSSGTVQHETSVGETDFDGSVISLTSTGINSYGSEFKISYSFQQNYSYKIEVTTRSIHASGGDPNLRLKIVTSAGTSAICGGPQFIDWSVSGSLAQAQVIPTGNFATKTFTFNSIASNNSYLTVANLASATGGSQVIEISSIKITATAPAPPPPSPSFTLSSSTDNIPCGSTTAVTFTVTNVNSSSVASYVFNLGTNNGWENGGVPAGSTITIVPPANSITLTPAACTNNLSGVYVTAYVGSTPYNSNSKAVSITAPVATVSGPDEICTDGNYSISTVPCNASYTWSSAPAGRVSFSTTTGTSTTVTKISEGNVIIRATVSTGCGNYEYSKGIFTRGVPADFAITASPTCQSGGVIAPSYFSCSPETSGATYHWGYIKNGGSFTQLPLQTNASISQKFGVGSYTIYAYATNSCGATDEFEANFNILNCGGRAAVSAVTLSPNPVSSFLTVSKVTGMDRIQVLDRQGNVKIQRKVSKKTMKTLIYVGGLKNDLYTVRVFDGNTWESLQVLINN